MSRSLPISLLDNQTLVAALLKIQAELRDQPKKVAKNPEVPSYVRETFGFPFIMSPEPESAISSNEELGRAIAAELWARGVLTVTLPTVEAVMREADRLVSGGDR